jgi:two-component system alkaline phosphatase synthesis response regulator PhoP
MIFCVEDDESARELMLYTLNAAGFEADGFADAASFWSAMKDSMPELVILDIMLPDEDGISILKKLRAMSFDIPVIMETAKGTEYDKVIGLDLGADDYLVKPFGMTELVSRVRAVLRRAGKSRPDVLRAGRIVLDQSSHTVSLGDKQVELTLKEYDLLRLLMSNPGKAFSRDMLLDAVWDTEYGGETRTVDVHIGTLRTKLGSEGDRIKTVRGVGYRLEV